MADIGVGDLDTLRDDFTGVVSQAGESSYDDAVNIWNGAITRRPAVVASCATSSDVAAALAFAQQQGLEVSVRGGGHNYAGFALCEGGLMIDLTPDEVGHRRCRGPSSEMRGWDYLGGVRRSHPGSWPGSAGRVHQPHRGRWIDSGRRIRLADPPGRTVGRQPGGSRGGHRRREGAPCVGVGESRSVLGPPGWGGNFGVVTEFEFGLHPVGPMLQLGLFMFSPDQGGDLFRFARDFVERTSRRLRGIHGRVERTSRALRADGAALQPRLCAGRGRLGDEQEHAGLVEPIKQALTPIVELITPIPYVGLQQMFDASAPWGMHNYEKAVYLAELSDGAIDAILEHQAKKMSPLSFVPIFPLGGAYRKADDDASAFGGSRDIRYVVNISATAMSPDDYEASGRGRARTGRHWSGTLRCRELCELHDRVRGGPRPKRLWRQVRPAPKDQVHLRSSQYLPSQRQHSACVVAGVVADCGPPVMPAPFWAPTSRDERLPNAAAPVV